MKCQIPLGAGCVFALDLNECVSVKNYVTVRHTPPKLTPCGWDSMNLSAEYYHGDSLLLSIDYCLGSVYIYIV